MALSSIASADNIKVMILTGSGICPKKGQVGCNVVAGMAPAEIELKGDANNAQGTWETIQTKFGYNIKSTVTVTRTLKAGKILYDVTCRLDGADKETQNLYNLTSSQGADSLPYVQLHGNVGSFKDNNVVFFIGVSAR